jgi:hypothetical protein
VRGFGPGYAEQELIDEPWDFEAIFKRSRRMSWSLDNLGINGRDAAEAKRVIAADTSIPETIKDYVTAGIDGLMARYGDDVKITAAGYGHLCDVPNKDTYDVTSATIKVSRTE